MRPDPMLPTFGKITSRSQESEDVFTLKIEPNTKKARAAFKPGQFNMLYVFGIGEVAISVSGDPENSRLWTHTIRSVGATTQALARLRVGDSIGLRGPYGTAWPVAEQKQRDLILIAGGLGLAPLRPAIYSVLHHRKNFKRVTLLYGSRSYSDFLFKKELTQWQKSGIDCLVSLSQADRRWKGRVGHVTTLLETLAINPQQTTAFICGPEIMMRFAASDLQKRGLKSEQIYVSMERNMKCAVGFCGHCQLQSSFICKDGPVFTYQQMESHLHRREL